MKVLIIEDSESKKNDILRNISKIVRPEDVTVCKYMNAGLVELRSEKHYDYLILDMQFPTLSDTYPEPKNGLGVLKRLKHWGKSLPVIVCSSCEEDCSAYENVIGYILYDSTLNQASQFEALMV